MNGLHFHAATGEGVAFHLIGALSEFGKLGVVCIGETARAPMRSIAGPWRFSTENVLLLRQLRLDVLAVSGAP